MARKVARQVQGIEAKVAESSGAVGESATTNSSWWHVPRWAYAAIGTLAGAVILYEAIAAATALPANPFSIGRSAQPTPPAASTPFRPPTQAVSQYQRQALEQIAVIGQTEPGLAELLPQTDWFSNGVDRTEAEFVTKIRKYVADGNYARGTITHNDGSVTNVLVLSVDKDKRTESLEKTRLYLPRVSQLLGIEYKRPLLVVDVLKGGGGANFWGVNITNPEDLEHELVHLVYEFSGSADVPLAQVPPWLVEGVPEVVRAYLYGGANVVELKRKNIGADLSGRGIAPLYDMSLVSGRSSQSTYDGGFFILAQYMNLAGIDNFVAALRQIHEARVVKSVLPHRTILNKDLENPSEEVKAIIRQQHEWIEAILEQHVPADKLNDFRQLYQQRVYGVQETKP